MVMYKTETCRESLCKSYIIVYDYVIWKTSVSQYLELYN